MPDTTLHAFLEKLYSWLLTSGLRLLVTALLLMGFMEVVALVGRRIRKMVDDGDPNTQTDREKRADTLVGIMKATAGVLALIAFIYALLRELGVNVAPLLAGAGIAGLAVGFGAQSIVKDLFYGFFILFENQFRVGDVVKVADVAGTVEEINLRTTVLRSLDGARHVIPNGMITTVCNHTFQWSCAVVDIGVGYDAEPEKAAAVLKGAAAAMKGSPEWSKRIIAEPEVTGIESFGDSAVVFRVLIKTLPKEQWAAAREYRRRVKEALDREGIDIPYPQMVVRRAKEG